MPHDHRFNESASRGGLRLLGLLCALLLAPGSVQAQQAGLLRGTAADVTGAPVPGIRVSLSSPALIGGPQVQLTDVRGAFRFLNLPPGVYEVRGDASGYASFVQQGLVLGLGQVAQVTLLMDAGGLEEVLTITGEVPIVDTEQVEVGQRLTDELLADVPMVRRGYQEAAAFLPGVLYTPNDRNPQIHGGSTTSNLYLVDGVSITDPVTNTFSFNFNFDAIAELQVITGGFSPEYGNASGGVIGIVTRSGSNDFELDASIYHASDLLSLEGEDGAPRDFSSLQLNVNVGGPILRDRLWYFFSMEYLELVNQLPAESPVARLDGLSHAAFQRQDLLLLGKLTFAANRHHRLTLTVQADPGRLDNIEQNASLEATAETHQDQTGMLASLRWDGLFDPVLLEVQAAYTRSWIATFPQQRSQGGSVFSFPGLFGFGELSETSNFGVVRGCYDSSVPGCRGDIQASENFGAGLHYEIDTGAQHTGNQIDATTLRTRWQLRASASLFFSGGGEHEAKLGGQLDLLGSEDTSSFPGGAMFFIDQDTNGDGLAEPVSASIVASDDNHLALSNAGWSAALFLLDRWKLVDRVLLQPGVRIEQVVHQDQRGEPVLDFLVVSPRFGFAVDLTGDGRTRLHGGAARLYETGSLFLSRIVGTSLLTREAYWNEAAGRYIEDPEQVQLQGGDWGSTIDPDLRPQQTDELQLGLERAITDALALDLTYLRRRTIRAWEDDEVNLIWNQAGTDVIGSYDGTMQQRYRLVSLDEARRYHDSLELTLRTQLGRRWALNGSYALAWLRGTTDSTISTSFDNPRQRTYLQGDLGADHRHTVKLQAVRRFDFGLAVGAGLLYQTGAPYDMLFLSEYDNDYTLRRAPRGHSPGVNLQDPSDDEELRLPDLLQIDLRVGFDLEPSTGVKLEALLDVLNVLNGGATTRVDQTATPRFGKPSDRQQPLQAQLGMRFRY